MHTLDELFVHGLKTIYYAEREIAETLPQMTDVVTKDTRFPGSIGPMIAPIIPSVLAMQRAGESDLVERSVEESVRRVVDRLQNYEAVLQDAQEAGKLKVVAAVYSLSTGEVRWLRDGHVPEVPAFPPRERRKRGLLGDG